MKQCRRCRIEGRVQGVFFRATARTRAQQLRVTGWARNLPDGSLEVLACGEESAVKAFCDWLWEGPPRAQVRHVSCATVTWEKHEEFRSG